MDKNEKEMWLDYYTGENCINCGRNRVEQSNKRKVCEKCNVNQDTGEYEADLMNTEECETSIIL